MSQGKHLVSLLFLTVVIPAGSVVIESARLAAKRPVHKPSAIDNTPLIQRYGDSSPGRLG